MQLGWRKGILGAQQDLETIRGWLTSTTSVGSWLLIKLIGPLPIRNAAESATDIDHGDHKFAIKASVWQTSEKHGGREEKTGGLSAIVCIDSALQVTERKKESSITKGSGDRQCGGREYSGKHCWTSKTKAGPRC